MLIRPEASREFGAESQQRLFVSINGNDASAARDHELGRRRVNLSGRAGYQGDFPSRRLLSSIRAPFVQRWRR
jgi:hypothetical protein